MLLLGPAVIESWYLKVLGLLARRALLLLQPLVPAAFVALLGKLQVPREYPFFLSPGTVETALGF